MAANQLPLDYEDLEFKVQEENWNDYEIQGGIRLLARSILVKVMRRKALTPEALELGSASQDVFITLASDEPRGPPSPLTAEEVSGRVKIDKIRMRIVRSNELWNTYEIVRTGDRIRTKLSVIDVYRVPNRFDKFGYPALIITSGVQVAFERRAEGALTP